MLNRVILIGRLTRDPELRKTTSGMAVASFAIAVDDNYKQPDGSKNTLFMKEFFHQAFFNLIFAKFLQVFRREHPIDRDFTPTAITISGGKNWGDKSLTFETSEINRHAAMFQQVADSGDGGEAFGGHRNDAFLFNQRKNGFHADWIHAEVLLGENLLFLESPSQMAAEKFAITCHHVEFFGIESFDDISVVKSREVIPKKKSAAFLSLDVVYHADIRSG